MTKSGKHLIALLALTLLAGLFVLSACGGESTPTPTALSTAVPPTVQPQTSVAPSATVHSLSQAGDTTPPATVAQTPDAGATTDAEATVLSKVKPKGTPTAAPPGRIVASNGFKPNPDGYSFENYVGKKRNGKFVPELTVSDLLKMFGDTDVCVKLENGVCTPRQEALDWLNAQNAQFLGGHCEGMAVSSLVIWKGEDNPGNYADGAKTTFDLKLNDKVKNLIAYYFILQMVDPVATDYETAAKVKPSEVLNQVIASMQNGSPDPVNLGFYGTTSKGDVAGHSITPYSVEDRGSGIFWIHVYDNNWPNKNDAYMEIDTNKETWSYDLSAQNPNVPPEVWSGDASTQTLAALPISERMGTLVCPWCDPAAGGSTGVVGSAIKSLAPSLAPVMPAVVGGPDAKSNYTTSSRSSAMQVIMNGDGHLLIKNSKGQRLGYDGTKLVNEIPGGRFTIPRGGMGVKMEPVYTLPNGEAYNITLDGQTVPAGNNGNSTVAIFGQGSSLTLQDIALNTGDKHQITLSADSRKLTFVAGNSVAAPTFRIATSLTKGASSNGPTSYLFQVGNVRVTKGQQMDFSLNRPAGQLSIKTSGTTNPTRYDLNIVRSDQSGVQSFDKANVTLNTNDTHDLDFSNWNSNLQVNVGVDQGSNGSVDSTQAVPTSEPTPQQ